MALPAEHITNANQCDVPPAAASIKGALALVKFPPHRWDSSQKSVRTGLSAGGIWIRTFGSPTDPLPLREQSAFHDGSTVSRPGTEISNPSPSSEEPVSRPNPLSEVKNAASARVWAAR
jgi:hypothetical protein